MGRPRKWKLNENYFDVIDTQEKAYWLGLLYADGHNNVRGNQITLSLKDSDIKTVEGLKNAVGSDAPVVVRANSGGFSPGGYYASFCMNSKYMCKSLADRGCGQCKGDHIRFPFWMDRSLWRHFIRGYFDGDGGFSKEIGTKRSPKHVKYRVNIISNPVFIEELNSVLEQEIGRSYYVQVDKNKKKTTQIQMGGGCQIELFLSWIYHEATVWMDRKYDLFKEFINRPYLDRKEVYAYEAKTGKFVGRYRSRLDAGLELGVDKTSVVRCCQDSKRTCGGYRFYNSPIHNNTVIDSHDPSRAKPIP